jgi:hypothetical protein
MADEVVTVEAPKTGPKGVSLITEMVRRQIQADPKATAEGAAPAATEPAKPTETKPAEAAKPADAPKTEEAKPRNEDGTFKEDPNKKAMREVIKRQQEEIKRLQQTKPAEVVSKPEDREAALVASMSKETREWYEKVGREAMGLQAKAVLAPHERALAKAEADLKEQEANAAWNATFNSWRADKMAEGEVVDERAMLTMLDTVDRNGWVLGKTDELHFDAVYGMLKSANPMAVAGIKTGKEAEEAAKKQAEELARAGGVRPGVTVTPTPQADRAAELKALRDASFRGDSEATSRHIRKRMRGMGIFPGERETAEGG